ncbi:Zinc knuckle family protein, partial [Aphelenchoides avenae]
MVLLPTEQCASHLAHHPPSATASSPALEPVTNAARIDSSASFSYRTQPIRNRDPVPTATYADQLGENQATSQGATATTAAAERAVPSAAAGGKGPSGSSPDGPSIDSEEDEISKSTFYRNGRFTRHTLPIEAIRTEHGMEKLPMRPFGGDIREYHQFRDSFLNGIESQPHLRPFQKLQHLHELLEETPRSCAEGYGICDVAYWEVLNMLEAHYGDNTIIQNTLRQDFVDMPPPTERPADLSKFLEEAVTLIGRLKRTGLDVDKNELYCSLLVGHLPVPTRLKLIQSYGCRRATKVSCVLDGLRQYLSDIKEAEERALTLRKPCKPAEDPPEPNHHQSGHEESGAPHTLCERRQQDAPSDADIDSVTQPTETEVNTVDNSSDDRLKERRTCPLCGLLHLAANCFMYPTIQKRLRRVLKLKICLLCLREGHKADVCPRRKKSTCKICGHGQHHRILCKDADDNSRRKALRSSQMRATTGQSERHFRKNNKSVTRNVTSIVTSATLRQGTQRSSSKCKSIPKPNRKKRTGNQGADSRRQAGTARPTTTSSDERMEQQTAKASRNGRLLSARHGQLKTEPSSTTDGSAKFQREQREAEEDSSTTTSGGDSDHEALTPEDPSGSTALQTDAIYCASSTTEPTTLLECIKATAENPTTGDSRAVLILFDSGSNRSFVSTELAHELSLPRHRPSTCRVHTFGNKLPATIEGFSASIVLRSKRQHLPPLA